MAGEPSTTGLLGIRARLQYFTWRWYRIKGETADDIVQSALLTYVQVRERYGGDEDRPDILLGILRNKCREHIDRRIRASRAFRSLRAAAEAGETAIPVVPSPSSGEGVLGELIHREDGRIILETLAQVRPRAREMFRLLAEGATRQDLLRRYRINKNTLDSRLHAYRGELRQKLLTAGVTV